MAGGAAPDYIRRQRPLFVILRLAEESFALR
jgi:hypothetical protein